MPLLLSSAKKRLTLTWFLGGGVIFFGAFVLAFLMEDRAGAQNLAKWLLPLIVPTLSLFVGVLVNDARAGPRPDVETDPFLYQLAQWLSAAYLIALVLAILIRPFMPLDESIYWIAALQAITTAALGAFFAAPDKKS